MGELGSMIDHLAADDVHSLPASLLVERTDTLLIVRNKLDAELARTLQALDVTDATVSECGRQTRGYLIEERHVGPTEASRLLWLARRLPSYPDVQAAMADGEVSLAHAELIINCLIKIGREWRSAAEPELIAFARDHDTAMLARLCKELRIRTGADESEEAAAQRMYEGRYLKVNTTFEGMLHLDGMFDPAAGAVIKAAIESLTDHGHTEGDTRNSGQRAADALTDLAEQALAHGDLPDTGGERPHLTVTIPFDELRNGIGVRTLGHATVGGHPLAVATARMLGCDAGVIPAVLGGAGEILDLGRATRTWTTAQRRAARLRDGGCGWPGCQAPISRCHLHHIKYWALGGPSDIDNSVHLCRFHHWLVHHTDWTITRNAAGHIEIRRCDRARPRDPVRLHT